MNSSAQDNQKQQYLSAGESDPIKMVWMQDSPPPKDKRLKLADGSFFEFPALRFNGSQTAPVRFLQWVEHPQQDLV